MENILHDLFHRGPQNLSIATKKMRFVGFSSPLWTFFSKMLLLGGDAEDYCALGLSLGYCPPELGMCGNRMALPLKVAFHCMVMHHRRKLCGPTLTSMALPKKNMKHFSCCMT